MCTFCTRSCTCAAQFCSASITPEGPSDRVLLEGGAVCCGSGLPHPAGVCVCVCVCVLWIRSHTLSVCVCMCVRGSGFHSLSVCSGSHTLPADVRPFAPVVPRCVLCWKRRALRLCPTLMTQHVFSCGVTQIRPQQKQGPLCPCQRCYENNSGSVDNKFTCRKSLGDMCVDLGFVIRRAKRDTHAETQACFT